MDVKVGDYVVRKSYNRDIIFKVKQVFQDETGGLSLVLKGVAIRLLADAPISDVVKLDPKETAGIIDAAEEKEIAAIMSR